MPTGDLRHWPGATASLVRMGISPCRNSLLLKDAAASMNCLQSIPSAGCFTMLFSVDDALLGQGMKFASV
jgi:hypothetical protein